MQTALTSRADNLTCCTHVFDPVVVAEQADHVLAMD